MSAYEVPVFEALSLVEAALADTSTELHASVAGWWYRASMPELLLVTAATHGSAAAMPWRAESDAPTDAEIAAAHAELLGEIRFKN